MKQIKAFKCEYCKKVLLSRNGMSRHEKQCYYNPISHSCITCLHLSDEYFYKGRILTDEEYFTREEIFDDEKMINKDNEYLFDCENKVYCTIKKVVLEKLKTQCNLYEIKKN